MRLSASAALAVAIYAGQTMSACRMLTAADGNFAVRDEDCKAIRGTQDTVCRTNFAKVKRVATSVIVESHSRPIWVSVFCSNNFTYSVDVTCGPGSSGTYPLVCPHTPDAPVRVDTLEKL
ncbi:hypothetical protein E4U53_003875 [Claviceps sorghi]|nr:hypothetical protein E4U53_003875 [Claviceps sorghi]